MNRYHKILEQISDIERALLEAIDEQCPEARIPDSIALPILNRLEARGEAISEAVDLIRNEIEELLAS